MANEKGLIEGLTDFSFSRLVTVRMIKLLYGLHLLAGLIAAVGLVLNGFRVSTDQGLLMLVLATIGLAFWVLYLRVLLELLVVIFRLGQNIAVIADRASRD